MREIKFRAWHKNTKVMLDPVDLHTMCVLNGGLGFSDDIVLMQYTGLKDKNGIEIYEGDIISFGGAINYIVIWGDEPFLAFYYKPIAGGEMFVLKKRECEKLEVIGNIFENPELLPCVRKGGKDDSEIVK